MPYDVTLMNLALQKIGAEDQLPDPDHDNFAARTLRTAWDEVRRATIRGTERFRPVWNFAKSYRALAARAITADWPLPYGFAALYPLPSECLRLVSIATPRCGAGDYELLTGPDATEIAMKVTGAPGIWFLRDVEEPSRWDAGFRDAFAARLAFQTADRISGDRGRKQDSWAEFEAAMKAATGADAMESPPVEPQESSWVEARWNGGPGYWPRGLAG